MKTDFENDNNYKWISKKIENSEIFFIGFIFKFGQLIPAEDVLNFLQRLLSNIKLQSELDLFIDSLSGHFSIYFADGNKTIAIVDRIRSYPIYYSINANLGVFSNSAIRIKNKSNLNEINENAKLFFEMSGYSLGRSTLIKDLFQLQAGEYIFINKKKNRIHKKKYYTFLNNEKFDLNQEQLVSKFDEINKSVFSKLIETLNGRQVVIPLSGGLDSRFILAFLKDFGYDNIKTYTYGIKNLWEIKAAKNIAEKTQTDWKYIEFKPQEIRKLFHTEDRRKYFEYASGLNTTPNLSGYFAHLFLKDSNFIDNDAVIINGQTGDFVSGNHIPIFNKKQGESLNLKLLLNEIIKKHYSLWENILSERSIETLSKEIIDLVEIKEKGLLSYQEFSDLFELLEWQERQAKYIVNGVRMYEWFGYDWRLPLWDDEYLFFWEKVPLKYKIKQNLFKEYLKTKNPNNLFNIDFPYKNNNSYGVKLTNKLIALLYKLTKNKEINTYQNILKYFQQYGPYYPQQHFKDFIKDGRHHRNPVSYWSQYVLKELF